MHSKPIIPPKTIYSQTKWFAPPQGWVKVTVDGTVHLNGSSAARGGLIHNEEGKWLIRFFRSLGCCSVLFAELLDVHDVLKHAWSMGHRRIILEFDSDDIVDVFNKQHDALYGNTLVSKIRCMLSLD
ncbi:hypothetical protein GQ457_18G017100 [Hibiscus cannabinus]